MTYAEIRAGATYRGKDGQPDRTVANLFTDWQGVAWAVAEVVDAAE
jgi:hypothetical protein